MSELLIYTSNFQTAGKHPDAMGISLGLPDWYTGPVFKHLAPPKELISMSDPERFTPLYHALVLAKLDPLKVVRHLNGKILLCWERQGTFCHRMVVARWLIEKTGAVVLEWEKEGKATLHTEQMGLF